MEGLTVSYKVSLTLGSRDTFVTPGVRCDTSPKRVENGPKSGSVRGRRLPKGILIKSPRRKAKHTEYFERNMTPEQARVLNETDKQIHAVYAKYLAGDEVSPEERGLVKPELDKVQPWPTGKKERNRLIKRLHMNSRKRITLRNRRVAQQESKENQKEATSSNVSRVVDRVDSFFVIRSVGLTCLFFPFTCRRNFQRR